MPPLPNPRRERFAQAAVKGLGGKGMGFTDAYRAAGYTAEGHAAHVGASRLMTYDDVRQRMRELIAPAVRKTRRTIQNLADRAQEIETAAILDGSLGVALNAVKLQADLLQAGGFDAGYGDLNDVEGIISRVEADLGAEMADLLRSMLAKPVTATHDLTPEASDDAIDIVDESGGDHIL